MSSINNKNGRSKLLPYRCYTGYLVWILPSPSPSVPSLRKSEASVTVPAGRKCMHSWKKGERTFFEEKFLQLAVGMQSFLSKKRVPSF